MKFDKIIKGGTIVSPEGRYQGVIGIKDGVIAAVAASDKGMEADEIIDAEGKYVLPGAVDEHLHYQEPINPESEDVEHATRAAAIGGITTGICMANLWLTSVKGYHDMQEVFNGKAYIDYNFHGWAKPMNMDVVEDLWTQTEVSAVKTYTTYDDFVTEADLWEILETGKKVNGLTMIHAENDALIKLAIKRLSKTGRKDPLLHVESRPKEVEILAIQTAIYVAEQTGAPLIVVHVSTVEGLKMIYEARQRGVRVWAETCPQYLTFLPEDMEKYGAYLAFAPVMRDQKNQDEMWDLLKKGYVSTVGSDHCPCPAEVKEQSNEDMLHAFCGCSGLEGFLAIFLDGVNRGKVSLERIVEVTSLNPAKLNGLYPRKGAIQAGADADIVIVDMEKEYALKEEDLRVKCGWSPYVGRKLKGWPVLTMVRGEVVAKDMEVVGEMGFGRQCPREEPFTYEASDL